MSDAQTSWRPFCDVRREDDVPILVHGKNALPQIIMWD